MFLEFIQNLAYSFYPKLVKIFNINYNFVKIYYNKNIKFFNKNFVDIALKTSQCIQTIKLNNLIFETIIPDLKNNVLRITFSNFYLVISIDYI